MKPAHIFHRRRKSSKNQPLPPSSPKPSVKSKKSRATLRKLRRLRPLKRARNSYEPPLVADLPDDPQRKRVAEDSSALSKRITLADFARRIGDRTVIFRPACALIEALSFIGGNWSIEILARAYEQELDASVRGAIFVALRDARSAA